MNFRCRSHRRHIYSTRARRLFWNIYPWPYGTCNFSNRDFPHGCLTVHGIRLALPSDLLSGVASLMVLVGGLSLKTNRDILTDLSQGNFLVPVHLFFAMPVSNGIVCFLITLTLSNLFDRLLRFLPETLRTVVGDGSVTPPPLYRPIIPIIKPKGNPCELPKPNHSWNPFRLLVNTDIIVLLVLNAIVCAVFYGFTATISTLFEATYPFLNETTIGLCFLAIGGGMVIGSVVNGRFLDWEYRRIVKDRQRRPEKYDTMTGPPHTNDNFPIEKVIYSTLIQG